MSDGRPFLFLAAITLVAVEGAGSCWGGTGGGPLVDRAGRAIGITTMGFRGGQGLNFAVAIDHARALLDGKPLQRAFVPAAGSDPPASW